MTLSPQDDGEIRDTPAEVDAAFRTLRRVALAYFALFLVVVAAFPILSVTLDWWLSARLLGDLSPGYLAVGVGLFVVFAGIGIAAATLSSNIEHRMLGTQATSGDESAGDGEYLP